jgi:uncharacterized membrane protein (DUF485 family)
MDKYDTDKALAHGGGLKRYRRKYKLKPRFLVLLAIIAVLLVYIIATIIIHYAPDTLVTSRYWREVFHP